MGRRSRIVCIRGEYYHGESTCAPIYAKYRSLTNGGCSIQTEVDGDLNAQIIEWLKKSEHIACGLIHNDPVVFRQRIGPNHIRFLRCRQSAI
uniref:AlNc14C303G10410 protein n=1 Tax=Albugo laibachii Nc14 TaxID=890382 RepID=F0WVS3_9STRA|nr:AlNc14C303G10410 [Albugo laibachii Nc14]|eukprot:CCA25519.1 AlNc14C303G10410 [Albugo laibachii Nc14]